MFEVYFLTVKRFGSSFRLNSLELFTANVRLYPDVFAKFSPGSVGLVLEVAGNRYDRIYRPHSLGHEPPALVENRRKLFPRAYHRIAHRGLEFFFRLLHLGRVFESFQLLPKRLLLIHDLAAESLARDIEDRGKQEAEKLERNGGPPFFLFFAEGVGYAPPHLNRDHEEAIELLPGLLLEPVESKVEMVFYTDGSHTPKLVHFIRPHLKGRISLPGDVRLNEIGRQEKPGRTEVYEHPLLRHLEVIPQDVATGGQGGAGKGLYPPDRSRRAG